MIDIGYGSSADVLYRPAVDNEIICGNTLDVLRTMPSESIDCCITSPPYWGLRAYGTNPQVWGGSNDCTHEWDLRTRTITNSNSQGKSTLTCWGVKTGGTSPHYESIKSQRVSDGFCKCGAWRGELGLEPTFQLYIKHLLEIFDEVYRVLKKTGTCWANLGDSYIGGKGASSGYYRKSDSERETYQKPHTYIGKKGGLRPADAPQTIPAKSLCNIPHRFAIGMTDHNWIQRNTIIWHKPSCMPSSAKDRFTVDFEYVFFFTKAKRYYFEQQFEAQSETESTQIRNKSTTNRIAPKYDVDRKLRPDKAEWTSQYRILPNGRNRRAVWRINPQPFKSAHFAVFPEKLVEPMILAGCPSAICDSCGAGYSLDNTFEYSGIKPKTNKRISGKTDLASGMTYPTFKDREHKIKRRNKKDLKEYLNNARKRAGYTINEVESILESQAPHHWFNGESYPAPGDWPRIKKLFNLTDNYDDTLTCDCNAPTHPGTVLDPFVGSGTTCLVARKLGRHYIGIDLNPDYCNMAEKRLREVL